MWLPDTDTLLRLALLAVALYLLLTVGIILLPYALAVVVVVGPVVGAVVLVRWLAGELGTLGAVLILTAGVGLGIFTYACTRRR
jgi:hypothetical protein